MMAPGLSAQAKKTHCQHTNKSVFCHNLPKSRLGQDGVQRVCAGTPTNNKTEPASNNKHLSQQAG